MDLKRGPLEVAISTDLRGAPYSFSLWDVHTGAQLVAFKGIKASPVPNCLQLIDEKHFITATDNVLQVWSIYNRKSQDQKLFLPGRPSALCMSPCGKYLIVGIEEKIYIWQLSSGNLLAHTQRHYQTVTVLRMNQKGTFLFSGGEDGLVLVWPFADLISGTHNTGALGPNKSSRDTGVNEPKFSWQHHSSAITDIHVTKSDCDICVTTSLDKTVNIYSYSEGKRIHCISDWPTTIWCAVMDKNCNRLFLGGQDGNIYEFAVSSLGISLIESRDVDSERKPLLRGHKDRVDRLLISLDGSMLVSGSRDSTCKVWDIATAKMIRDIKHDGAIANLTTFTVAEAFAATSLSRDKDPPLLLKPLKRHLHKMSTERSEITTADLFEESSSTIVNIRKTTPVATIYHQNTSVSYRADKADTTKEDEGVKRRLRELYLLSTEKVFKDVAKESLAEKFTSEALR